MVFPCFTWAQVDSVETKKLTKKAIYGAARKATIMSALVPGLGQVYNKKYWKVPIIYGALGGLGYFFIQNNNKYNLYRSNLKAIYDDDSSTKNQTLFNETQLVTLKNYYRRYRDLSIIGGVLIYTLNIIDANVDAHLSTFDVSDDLSLQISPYGQLAPTSNLCLQTGISLKLHFK